MSALPGPVSGPSGRWAMQQLAGFLSSISEYPNEAAMVTAAAHRIAEAIDAEVCAISVSNEVRAVIGLAAGADLCPEFDAVLAGTTNRLTIPGLGEVEAVAVSFTEGQSGSVLVGRTGAPLDADERHLLRAMAQVLELALRLRRTADDERTVRKQYQAQTEELLAANEQLEQMARAKTDFVTTTSHELRTPLVAMMGFAGLLAGDEGRADPAADEYLDAISRHGRRLMRLVDDLLLVGRLEDHRVEADIRPVPLVETTRAILEGTGRSQVVVSSDGDADAAVLVDPGHLEQMVLNLVDNAFKYGAEPVSVQVEIGSRAVVSVIDHGDGVPPDFVPELFERFTQASTGHRRNASGTGLGLSIVDGLATLNGGTVAYRREGDLTRFSVHLPLADGAADAEGLDDDATSSEDAV